jgi:hypothetical protein
LVSIVIMTLSRACQCLTLITLFELIVEDRAFIGSSYEIANSIRCGNYPSIGDDIPVLAQDLITHCWAQGHESRPDFRDIVRHLKSEQFELLLGVEVEKLLSYVAEIEQMDVRCYHTPINPPPIIYT